MSIGEALTRGLLGGIQGGAESTSEFERKKRDDAAKIETDRAMEENRVKLAVAKAQAIAEAEQEFKVRHAGANRQIAVDDANALADAEESNAAKNAGARTGREVGLLSAKSTAQMQADIDKTSNPQWIKGQRDEAAAKRAPPDAVAERLKGLQIKSIENDIAKAEEQSVWLKKVMAATPGSKEHEVLIREGVLRGFAEKSKDQDKRTDYTYNEQGQKTSERTYTPPPPRIPIDINKYRINGKPGEITKG